MSDQISMHLTLGIVCDALSKHPKDEQNKILKAIAELLADTTVGQEASMNVFVSANQEEHHPEYKEMSLINLKARQWMKKHNVTNEEVSAAFDIEERSAELILGSAPGKNEAEQTINSYLLLGVSRYISTGAPSFPDKDARSLCDTLGCYQRANHATILKSKNKRNKLLKGSKDGGWTLTSYGLEAAAKLLKNIKS